MSWQKGNKVWTYKGENYYYAYSKVIDNWCLIIETKTTPDIKTMLKVKNPKAAKEIVKLLEL